MATQLALQRNFVTIKSENQSAQSSRVASSATTNDGDIVTITTAGNSIASNSNSGPIHVMQQVNHFIWMTITFVETTISNCQKKKPIIHLFLLYLFLFVQKKYILQAGTTSDGVSIIDVVPIDQSESTDDAPITVSTILPTNSGASSPSSSNSQQITAQVAFVQTQDGAELSDNKPHFITVNGKSNLNKKNIIK